MRGERLPHLLLKDIALLDKMYELNKVYFKELAMAPPCSEVMGTPPEVRARPRAVRRCN